MTFFFVRIIKNVSNVLNNVLTYGNSVIFSNIIKAL